MSSRAWSVAALVATIAVASDAASSGNVGLCNPHGNAGCSTWTNGDRMRCTESVATRGIMTWVARPVRDSSYTIAPKHPGTTHYIPGTTVELAFRVLDPDMKYRGLLVDAVDGTNTTVGGFVFSDPTTKLFWEPPGCPGALVHASADAKPFGVTFSYTAPPAGTGPIRFRALVKKGVANMGYFYHPPDLVLEEIEATAASRSMTHDRITLTAGPGVPCAEHCMAEFGYDCDGARLAEIASADAFKAVVSPYHRCPAGLVVPDCAAAAPGLDENGTCLFPGGAELCPGGIADAARSCAEVAANMHCAAAHPGIWRFCACVPAPTASPTMSPTAAPAVAAARRRARRTDEAVGSTNSAAAAPASPGRATAVLLPVLGYLSLGGGAGGGGGRATLLGSLAVAILSLAQPADTHNWVMTPSRASREASTTGPCRGRRNPNDKHAQVGPGQDFVVQHATGHGGNTVWVLLHGSNESWLSHRNFNAMVRAYINEGPSHGATNMAQHPRFQRMHGVTNRHLRGFNNQAQTLLAEWYNGTVPPTDPYYMTHRTNPTDNLYRFTDAKLADDKYMSYSSPRYPWIEAAWIYTMVGGPAFDYDSIRARVPGFAGPGHYIMHWRWGGYFDCIDVEHFTDRQVPEDQIDGVASPGNTWGKVDHCQYTNPLRVLSRCMPANGGAQKCLDAVNTGWHNDTGGNSVTPRYLDRIGINVVPLVNPNTTAFPDRPTNIPWRNETCSNSEMSRLSGPVTYNPTPISLQERVGEQLVGHSCDGPVFREVTTIRGAVQRCSVVHNCNFLSWEPDFNTTTTTTGMWTGEHTFRGCARSTTRGYVNQRVFPRPAQFNSNYDVAPSADEVYRVSFQPADTTGLVQALGWHGDTGAPFQWHGSGASSLEFGWSCQVPTCQPRRGGWAIADGNHCMAYNPGSNAQNATAQTTRVTSLQNGFCGEGASRVRNKWRISLPNGVYQTEIRMGMPEARIQNCIIQGFQFTTREIVRGPMSTKRVIEVTDGQLTLEAIDDTFPGDGNRFRDQNAFQHSAGCGDVTWITMTRLGTANSLPELWFPGSGPGGAWRQEELSERVPVGLVSIELPINSNALTRAQASTRGRLTDGAVDGNLFAVGNPHLDVNNLPRDCRMRWFYDAHGCTDRENNVRYNIEGISLPLKVFDNPATEGAVVSVADTPCNANGCPGGTVCTRIEMQNRQWQDNQWPGGWTQPRGHTIDCNGAVGRYLRVHLPGAGRRFQAQVSVNKVTVTSDDPDQLVCYAVEGRISTTTLPDYVTTDDPEDPIYYSTCYVRGPSITWLPPQVPTPVEQVQWNLGEGRCLDCDSYRAVLREGQVPNNASVPFWQVISPCSDCASPEHLSTLANGSGLVTCAVAGAEADDEDEGDSNTTTVVVVVLLLLLLISLMGGYVYYRKKHLLPMQPWLKSASSYSRHRARPDHGDASLQVNPMYDHRAPSGHGARPAAPARQPPSKAPASDPPTQPMPPSRPQPPSRASGAPVRPPAPASRTPAPPPAEPIRSEGDAPAVPTAQTDRHPVNQAIPATPAVPSKPNLSSKSAASAKPAIPAKPKLASKPVGPATPVLALTESWEADIDQASGDVYFVSALGATQWECPAGPQWSATVDKESGAIYYTDDGTGSTQWEMPTANENSESEL